MTALRAAAGDYLALRRAVGFKLMRGEGLLFDFVDYTESHGATSITTEMALRWATLPADATVGWWRSRLCVVRCFARYMTALDPSTEVPPLDLLPRVNAGSNRATPYLYSTADIEALLAAARTIPSTLAAATSETLIGLLAVTGMRVGEALRLDRDDLDRGYGLLRVRDSKFDRSREVPLHDSTLDALDVYAAVCDEHFPTPRSTALFVSTTGGRLAYRTVNWRFQRLVHTACLQPFSPRCRPRLHDFRH